MKHFFDMMMTVMVGFVTGVFRGKGNALQFVKVLVSGQAAGAQTWLRACPQNHSRNLHAPLCGIFCPNSVAVARYGALIRTKSPTNCDAHLAERLLGARSSSGCSEGPRSVRGKNSNRIRDVFYKRSNRIRDVFHKNSNRIRDVYFKKGLPYMRQSVCRGSPL